MFAGWDSYFTLLGTAAASLIGLLFVVVTLTGGFERAKAERGQSLYMTPTMLNFAVVLSGSLMTMVPGLTAPRAAALLGVATLAGLGNAAWACLGIRQLGRADDPPHWTDFWMYGVTPAVVYVALGAVCAVFAAGAPWAANALAALLLTLLLVGVRNAWDLITWIATGRAPSSGPRP